MRFLYVALCVLATGIHVIAAERTHDIQVDDYFTLGILNEIAISCDAQAVAYTEGRWQESTNDRKTDIWVVPYAEGEARRLTFDRAGYDTLRWHPSGACLYCASELTRGGEKNPPFNGSRQVWRIAADGSSRIPVTQAPGGIEQFELTASGDAVIYSTSSEVDTSDWSKLKAKFPNAQYGTRQEKKTTISRVDLKTWHTTQIATIKGAVDSFSISPNGKWVAMVTSRDGSVIEKEGHSVLIDLNTHTGKTYELLDHEWMQKQHSRYGTIVQPCWSSDGESLAFCAAFDGYPNEIFVATWDDGMKLRKVKRPDPISVHGGVDGGVLLGWRPETQDLYFLADDHARVRIMCATDAPTGGKVEAFHDDDAVNDSFAWSSTGGCLAAIRGDHKKMHDVYLHKDKHWKQLTTINAHTEKWKLPKISIVEWQGYGNELVRGVLELPADRKPGERLPLIVNLHGGPTAAAPYNTQYGFTGSVLFASQGYAFFSPNYRGSTGYGDKFIEELVKHQNEYEVADIQKGVDHLIDAGIADKDRLGVSGWSNGGYLTNCLITKDDRFKAASSGAGIIDQTMHWGISDEPAFPIVFNGGLPWKEADKYRDASPIHKFGNVKTPTIFHVGEQDLRCPKEHSQAGFRALNDYLKHQSTHPRHPSELIVYPDEGHTPKLYSSRKAKLTWDLSWFDHHLKGKPIPQ